MAAGKKRLRAGDRLEGLSNRAEASPAGLQHAPLPVSCTVLERRPHRCRWRRIAQISAADVGHKLCPCRNGLESAQVQRACRNLIAHRTQSVSCAPLDSSANWPLVPEARNSAPVTEDSVRLSLLSPALQDRTVQYTGGWLCFFTHSLNRKTRARLSIPPRPAVLEHRARPGRVFMPNWPLLVATDSPHKASTRRRGHRLYLHRADRHRRLDPPLPS